MATVHYENGKLHVHKEIIENAKKEKNEHNAPGFKKNNITGEHIVTQPVKIILSNTVTAICVIHKATKVATNFHRTDFPPPRI